MSRDVWLKRALDREDARNDATMVMTSLGARFDAAFPREAPTDSFEDLFGRYYMEIREILNGQPEPGLGFLAVSAEGLEGMAWFEAKENDANPLILGRHSSAEIFLPSDPRLSLRHLAVILHGRRAMTPARFSVLDLRTSAAFADEHGQRREAIESDGPVMVRCASLALLLFPTGGSHAPWPLDREAAWKQVPERLYFDPRAGDPASEGPERGLVPEAPQPRAAVGSNPGSITLVPTLPGPIFPSRDLALSDPPRGELVVLSHAGQVSLRLGMAATRQGVLLGRYDRCDTAGLPVLSNPSLSRVHLLVIELDGSLYAVDTASTNGSWLGSKPMRCTRLLPGLRVRLAHDATVEWRAFH